MKPKYTCKSEILHTPLMKNLRFILLLLISSSIYSQSAYGPTVDSTQFIPHFQEGHPIYHQIDRWDILSGTPNNLHTAIRRYNPKVLQKAGYATDQEEIDTTRNGWLHTFYKNPNLLYEVREKDFAIGFNILFDLAYGRESQSGEAIYLNKRGVELYGELDGKFYFYSSYEENQSNFLNYQVPFIEKFSAIRGRGNYKDYQSSIFDSVSGYDYGFATGYLGYKLSTHTSLEIGHSRHFIGNGIRSLLLSNSGHNYFNVKFEANFWKLNYQAIFAELSTISARFNRGNVLLPKKYMASHYLSFKPTSNIELGVYESIIFSRENNFELQYLNPVIFYRTIEHQLDSPDNVLIGLNAKWNLYKTFSLYGQFVLDELNVSEFFSSSKWWANKYGIQLGIKYPNAFTLNHLDAQLEVNRVRPYTYSHWRSSEIDNITVSNYSHFNQPLAHPLGANFTELIFKLIYQPSDKIVLTGQYLYTQIGVDPLDDSVNFGSNILITNASRTSNFGVTQHQGNLKTIHGLTFLASYELTSNLYWDIQGVYRSEASQTGEGDISARYIGTGLRYNVAKASIDY